jgi:hypothetical protein
MRKFALLLAAAGCLLTVPAVVQPASAETYVRTSSGSSWGGPGYRSRAQVVVSNPQRCRTVTVRTKRWDGSVVIKKQRRC